MLGSSLRIYCGICGKRMRRGTSGSAFQLLRRDLKPNERTASLEHLLAHVAAKEPREAPHVDHTNLRGYMLSARVRPNLPKNSTIRP